MNFSVQTARELVSKGEFARRRGCSAAYVSKLIRTGKLAPPALTPMGKIDVELALEMLGGPSAQLQPDDTAPIADDGVNYAVQRARREKAQATLAELELAEAENRLIDRLAYDRRVENRLRQLRDRILAVPRDIAGECARLGDEIAIEGRMNQALKRVLAEVSTDGKLETD